MIQCPLCPARNDVAGFVDHLWNYHRWILLSETDDFKVWMFCPACDILFGGTIQLVQHMSFNHSQQEIEVALHAKILGIQPREMKR